MNIVVEKDLAVPMRDEKLLRADLYRPDGDGPFPTLLQRTPYNKEFLALTGLTLDPVRAAARGYAVIIQDVRARWASEGDIFYMYRDELQDGADTVGWAVAQPWCDGQIGTYGLSYLGATAWLTAAAAPDAVRAIAPTTAPFDFWNNHLRRGGALNLGLLLSWALGTIGPSALARKTAPSELGPALSALTDAVDEFERWARHAPTMDMPPAQPWNPDFIPFFFDILKRHVADDFTRSLIMNGRHAAVHAPALIIAGWHDVLLESDLAHFAAMKRTAGSQAARDQTRLVVGPWSHGMFQHVVGDVDFGLRSNGLFMDLREDLTALHLRWFDHWLSGRDSFADEEPPVRIFVQGANRWRDESHWPPERAAKTRLFLGGDGTLAWSPEADQRARSYVFDPNDPCPTTGGPILLPLAYRRGPLDQREWLQRDDVLAFMSEPLDKAIEVTGEVRAVLYAATTGRDTDWVAKLCDVDAKGRCVSVCDGVLRARFRCGPEAPPALVEPGEIQQYAIDLSPTSMLFRRGHRLCLLVTSSDFPRYDRNPNTGEWPAEAVRFESARQTIFCGGNSASHVVLPIVANPTDSSR